MIAFPDWLLRDQERRTVLCEADYVHEVAGEPVTDTLYLSNRPYIDNVANQAYTACISRAPRYTRTLAGENRNSYQSSFGSMELANHDGRINDFLVLAITELRYYFGDFEWLVADFAHMFTCMCKKVTAPSRETLSVELRDIGVLLNKSIGGEVLVGGSSPEAERSRPVVFGYAHQLPCYLLDEASLTYVWADDGTYLQDDPTLFQPTVREGGTPTSYVNNGNGTFSLVASPIKQITSDLLVTPAGSPAYRAASDALSFVVEERCGLGALGLYVGPGPTYDTRPGSGVAAYWAAGGQDLPIGFALLEKTNVISLVDQITSSGNCFWAATRLNEFTIGRLRPHDIDSLGVTPAKTLGKDAIDKGTLRVDKVDPTYWRLNVRVNKNYVQQTDFVDALTPEERSYLGRPGQDVQQYPMAGNTFVANPQLYVPGMSESPMLETLISDGGDESTEEIARHAMAVKRGALRPWLALIGARTGIDRYDLELGDVVPVLIDTEPSLGLDVETEAQVVSHEIDLQDAKVTLQLLCQLAIEPGEETEEEPPGEPYIPLPAGIAGGRPDDPHEPGAPPGPPGSGGGAGGGGSGWPPVGPPGGPAEPTALSAQPRIVAIPLNQQNPFDIEVGGDDLDSQFDDEAGTDPTEKLCFVVQISMFTDAPCTIEVGGVSWAEDPDQPIVYGTGLKPGSLYVTSGITAIRIPAISHDLDLVDAAVWPDVGTTTDIIPEVFASRKNGSTTCDLFEVDFNGSATLRAAFFLQGPTGGVTNTFDEYLQINGNGTVTTFLPFAFPDGVNVNLERKHDHFDYRIDGGLWTTLVGSSITVPDGASDIEIISLDVNEQIAIAGAYYGDVSSMDGFPTGDVSFGGGPIRIALSNVNGPYAGMSFEVSNIRSIDDNSSIIAAEVGAGLLLPVPIDALTVFVV
jgi:hypothetical protein